MNTTTSRGVTFRRPSQDEKHEQAQILTLVETLGGIAYVLGTRRAQYCGVCGSRTTDQGTRQTPGISDLFVILPPAPRPFPQSENPWIPIWIECKGKGGTLTPEQVTFRNYCRHARIAHLVGGVDETIAWLELGGWIRTARRPSVPGQVTPRGNRVLSRPS